MIFLPILMMGQDTRLYKSIERQDSLERKYPELVERRYALEESISSIDVPMMEENITLPLVFHVLYKDEQSRVTTSEIENFIEALNSAYYGNYLSGDHPSYANGYDSRFADIQIKFCKSKTTNPINYHQTTKAEWQANEEVKKSYPPITPDSLINVWIVDLPEEVRGYAQFPNGKQEYDGIVLNAKEIKNHPQDLKSTIAHLMGNYLGLYPLWGRCYCCDDYVEDTPIANAPNYKVWNGYHVSLCEENAEMTSNAMDASTNFENIFFTLGQKRRILKTIKFRFPDLFKQFFSIPRLGKHNESSINIFPNPVYKFLNIQNVASFTKLNIYDISKNLVRTELISNRTELKLDVEALKSGIYFIEMISSEKNKIVKFVKF